MKVKSFVIYILFGLVICLSACGEKIAEEDASMEVSMEADESETLVQEENDSTEESALDESEDTEEPSEKEVPDTEASLALKEKIFSDEYSWEEKNEFAFSYMGDCAKMMEEEIHLLTFDEEGRFAYKKDGYADVTVIDIPKYVLIRTLCKGDIGADGVEEVALVMELYVPGEEENDFFDIDGQRVLFLYRQKEDGTYEYWKENNRVVEGKYNGGVLGDPFAGMKIKEGELCVYIYGGSSDRWGYDYYFNMRGGELVLERYVWINQCTHNNNMAQGTVYYEEGREETYAYPLSDSENAILIGEETFEPFFNTFEEAGSYGDDYPEFHFQGYMPEISRLDFDGTMGYHASTWTIQPTQTADEVFDEIKDTYYPELYRVEAGYSEEIIANKTELLGYEFPTYYYEDANGNRLYYRQMYLSRVWNKESEACIVHKIWYEAYEDGKHMKTVHYELHDATGEVLMGTTDYSFLYEEK